MKARLWDSSNRSLEHFHAMKAMLQRLVVVIIALNFLV